MPQTNQIDNTSFRPRKIRIGDHLIAQQLITQEQLEAALQSQKNTSKKLGAALIELGAITHDQLLNFLAEQLNIEYVDIKKFTLKPEIVNIIPEIHARRFRIIALKEEGDTLVIGMADPTDLFAYDEIAKTLHRPIKTAVVSEDILLRAIDKLYQHTEEIEGLAEEVDLQLTQDDDESNLSSSFSDTSDAPLIKLLRTMLEDAVRINASDIHIEPEQNETRTRFRIDGALHVQTVTSKRIAGALTSRLKLMAGLDISEKRLPQDGRFNFIVGKQHIDVRLSTMPMQYGESAVMRLLNQSTGIPDLNKIGIAENTLNHLRRNISSPHGLILVTGPTGSGKTTTLYSALKELNSINKKIITIEDPIEFRLPGITQIQVNAKIDLSFSRVLRSLLRQDPDIVLVGEMRDSETVETALRTSMTGHLVLSTLHTNDTISSISRLIDMGAPPYLIAASLRAVLAQRLVRKICANCSTPSPLSNAQKTLFRKELGDKIDNITFLHGKGCAHCNETGYHGRICISEYIEIKDELIDCLHTSDLKTFATLAARQADFRTLKASALDLAALGTISIEEVMSIYYGSS